MLVKWVTVIIGFRTILPPCFQHLEESLSITEQSWQGWPNWYNWLVSYVKFIYTLGRRYDAICFFYTYWNIHIFEPFPYFNFVINHCCQRSCNMRVIYYAVHLINHRKIVSGSSNKANQCQNYNSSALLNAVLWVKTHYMPTDTSHKPHNAHVYTFLRQIGALWHMWLAHCGLCATNLLQNIIAVP